MANYDYRDPRYLKEHFDELRSHRQEIDDKKRSSVTYREPASTIQSGNIKYHRTPDGKVRLCSARVRNCPYEHVQGVSSESAAVKAFENKDEFNRVYKQKKISIKEKFKTKRDISRRAFIEELKKTGNPESIKFYEEFPMIMGTFSIEREIRRPNREPEDAKYFHEQPNWKLKFVDATSGKQQEVYYDSLTEYDIAEFMKGRGKGFMGTPVSEQFKTFTDEEEIDRVLYEAFEHYYAVESLAKVSPNQSRRSSTKLVNHWINLNPYTREAFGNIDYNTSSFDPDFFPDLLSNKTVSKQDIKLSNTDAGLGKAGWVLEFKDSKQILVLTGSRGDKQRIEVRNERELSEILQKFYGTRVQSKRSKKKNFKDKSFESEKRNIDFIIRSIQKGSESFANAAKHAEVREALNKPKLNPNKPEDLRKILEAEGVIPPKGQVFNNNFPPPRRKRRLFGR